MGNEETRAPKKLNRLVLAIILLVVLGPIVGAVILRIFVVEAFKVPAGSMMPTLYVSDRMFVSKGNKKPERGEVIVFRYPENPSQDFVKRVAATRGDTLEVVDGRPVVNGKLVGRWISPRLVRARQERRAREQDPRREAPQRAPRSLSGYSAASLRASLQRGQGSNEAVGARQGCW